MSKGRRGNHVVEEDSEGDSRSLLGGGESDQGMMNMLRALMEEQRKNEIAREEARERAEAKREERREEARLVREEESLKRKSL